MKSRKPSRKQLSLSCAEPGPGDGLDPRYDARGGPPRAGKRKALQLCREAERTLGVVLAGECGNDLLRELTVLSVVPAPNAGRLLVTVGLPSSTGASAEQVLARLVEAAGLLRGELAAAVRRRRAPELAFRVVLT